MSLNHPLPTLPSIAVQPIAQKKQTYPPLRYALPATPPFGFLLVGWNRKIYKWMSASELSPLKRATIFLQSRQVWRMRNPPAAKGKDMEARSIEVCGIDIAWNPQHGTCTFEGLPVAMMWVDSTLAEMMAGLQTMVGAERFALALQSEGRKSVETDWAVISKHADFGDGFKAIANIAAVAGWGRWTLTSFDEKNKECRFRVTESREGRYQRALGVCWGSGMLAGKMAGYCSKLLGTNCWADQTLFIAKGDSCDEFLVKPS